MSASPQGSDGPTLLDHLARHAEDQPGKPFVIDWRHDSYRVLTYGDLLADARSVASVLAVHPRGATIFIILQASADLYPVYIGAMLAGLVPCFLPFPTPKQDPTLYAAHHRTLFAMTAPACIITYAGLAESLRAIAPDGTAITDVETISGVRSTSTRDGQPSCIRPSLDATAVLQFSSGTTGLKKGVALTFRHIAEQAAAYVPVAALTADAVVVSWLPLYHDMGLFTGFLLPLSVGASVVAIDPFEWVSKPTLVLRLIALFRGTHVWLPNFAFQHILATTDSEATYDLSSIRQIVSCSEVVKPAVLRRFATRFTISGLAPDALRACYAMAEASFAVTQSAREGASGLRFRSTDLFPGATPQRVHDTALDSSVVLASNGPPLPGIDVAIAHEGAIAQGPTTRVGEIVLRGPFVFDHYHEAPQQTTASIREGWYHTGDIGFLFEGALFICGRLKETIIVHGRNFYCHDIEAIVSDVVGVAPGRAVAIGEHDEGSASEEVLLIVELERDDPTTHAGIRRDIKLALASQLDLTPREIVFVGRGWLVKTTSGKMSRSDNHRRLRQPSLEDVPWTTKRAS